MKHFITDMDSHYELVFQATSFSNWGLFMHPQGRGMRGVRRAARAVPYFRHPLPGRESGRPAGPGRAARA